MKASLNVNTSSVLTTQKSQLKNSWFKQSVMASVLDWLKKQIYLFNSQKYTQTKLHFSLTLIGENFCYLT
jgi:hypothetical protein